MKYVVLSEVPNSTYRIKYHVRRGVWSSELPEAMLFDAIADAQQLIYSLGDRMNLSFVYWNTLRVITEDEAAVLEVLNQ